MGLFDGLDAECGVSTSAEEIIRAPFGWPGGKSKSLKEIIPHLPQTRVYVEPFGGSFAVGLARAPSKMEVLNDRYAGVVAFYRVIKNPELFDKLVDWLELTIHAREEFRRCQAGWERTDDDVERAGQWYYMIQSSFSSLGRNWGRTIKPTGRMAGKVRDKLKYFPEIHQRMKYVQVENQDWFDCMTDYDSPETVFYVDPPYADAYSGIYKHEMKSQDYTRLVNTIFNCDGFVALSGYAGHPLFESQNWDERYTWDAYVSIESAAFTEGNRKAHLKDVSARGKAHEVLWIKHAK